MVGSTRSRRLVARIRDLGWGRVFCGRPSPYPGEPWALDNGAFAAWKGGKAFDVEKFAAHAVDVAPMRPLFGVLPDIVGQGDASLRLSLDWLPKLPQSVPWYLAVQDGMNALAVEGALERVAGLFLGGTTAFKSTAPFWSAMAHRAGRRFHYARVSTRRHVRAAVECGADSCDSTQPLWSDRHWIRFERMVFEETRQVALPSIGGTP